MMSVNNQKQSRHNHHEKQGKMSQRSSNNYYNMVPRDKIAKLNVLQGYYRIYTSLKGDFSGD